MKATYVLGMKLYKEGFSYFKMGYASAISWIIFIVIMLITLVLFATSKRWVFYGVKAEKGRVSIMTKSQKRTLNLVLTYLVIILIGCVLLFPIALDDFGRVQNQRLKFLAPLHCCPKASDSKTLLTAGKAPVFIPMQPISSTPLSWSFPTTLLTIASSALVAYGFARIQLPVQKAAVCHPVLHPDASQTRSSSSRVTFCSTSSAGSIPTCHSGCPPCWPATHSSSISSSSSCAASPAIWTNPPALMAVAASASSGRSCCR